MRARVSDEPSGFAWVEQGKLAASGYPASRRQVKWFEAQGVSLVLTLTEEPLPEELRKGFSIEFEHVPMRDHQAPDVRSLEDAAGRIRRGLDSGKVVAVHCLAGQGRTGCALAGFMVKERGMTAEKALEALRRIKPEFVERSQEKSIFDLESRASKTRTA
ncbi:MAG: dual specificity protein phosphatase family protein [Thaumarchaeota archaeon]|nr:dual specificity protein phosphatase family protein [Nitrososphaerota archaeon]